MIQLLDKKRKNEDVNLSLDDDLGRGNPLHGRSSWTDFPLVWGMDEGGEFKEKLNADVPHINTSQRAPKKLGIQVFFFLRFLRFSLPIRLVVVPYPLRLVVHSFSDLWHTRTTQ